MALLQQVAERRKELQGEDQGEYWKADRMDAMVDILAQKGDFECVTEAAVCRVARDSDIDVMQFLLRRKKRARSRSQKVC